ncbi:acetylcholinesterase-like [Amblyomma americanum]
MKRVVVVAILLKALLCAAYDVQRTTDLGPVGGRKIEILGTTIEEYRGIPFAEPPNGELRFKPPVPAKPWEGTLNATSRRSGCPQPMLNMSLTGDIDYGEDCLHLNVWAREGSSNAPVLVWIYGGGFTYGSASHDNYTGAVIAAKTGIVVASINYRVGVLGFLNAESPESPGNMGFLDQNLALKWIKKNIERFGGDPSSITLFGESAGAMSAHAHMLSPMSRGLFRRAIAMSGVINSPEFTETPHESVAKGDTLAAIVGCRPDNKTLVSHPDEVIGCLRTRSADELVAAAFRAVPGKFMPFLPTYHDAFLPEEPSAAIRSGSFDTGVELLTGVTSDEGVTFFYGLQPESEILAEHLDHFDREALISALHKTVSSWAKGVAPPLLNDDEAEITSKAAIRRKYVDYLGDRLFVCPMHTAAAAHASRGGTVYTYVFDHWPTKRAPLTWAGVGHGFDLPYIFGLPLLDRERVDFSDEDVGDSEKHLIMMGAFAGLPVQPGVSAWPKYTANSPISMLLKNDNYTNIVGFRSEHCDSSSGHP